jgi:hypothetical protein
MVDFIFNNEKEGSTHLKEEKLLYLTSIFLSSIVLKKIFSYFQVVFKYFFVKIKYICEF